MEVVGPIVLQLLIRSGISSESRGWWKQRNMAWNVIKRKVVTVWDGPRCIQLFLPEYE